MVVAFDHGENNALVVAYGSSDFTTRSQAVRSARRLALRHAGAVAWSSDDGSGPRTIVFSGGVVPTID